MSKNKPSRGDIWFVDLNPVRGHEQAGRRPCLVISVDLFNHGPADLVVVLPITTNNKGIPFHVHVEPTAGGLAKSSFIKCEDIRSIANERFVKRLGTVSAAVMAQVEERLLILMGL